MHYVMVVCQLLCFNFVFVEYSYTGVITQESGSHCTVKEEKMKKEKMRNCISVFFSVF